MDHRISKPLPNPTFRVLSLGGGVQSSTIALLAAEGEITPPDFAIFADTGWEPKPVYRWIDHLMEIVPFPIITVKDFDVRQNVFNWASGASNRFVSLPFFTQDGGMVRRQCTREAKIDPIIQEVRRRAGLKPRERAAGKVQIEQWIGISTDEIHRLTLARQRWIHNRYPLIELRMNRLDCIAWLDKRGFPITPGKRLYVSKSSCIGCPFHSDAEWARMKRDDPESFADAVAADHALRANGKSPGMREHAYLHRSCRPLDEVDFDKAGDQRSFFDCSGHCDT